MKKTIASLLAFASLNVVASQNNCVDLGDAWVSAIREKYSFCPSQETEESRHSCYQRRDRTINETLATTKERLKPQSPLEKKDDIAFYQNAWDTKELEFEGECESQPPYNKSCLATLAEIQFKLCRLGVSVNSPGNTTTPAPKKTNAPVASHNSRSGWSMPSVSVAIPPGISF